MSNLMLPIYRLPLATATQVGRVRVVVDRNQRVYIAGSAVVTAVPSGDFLILTLANDQVYYVKARDYQMLQSSSKRRR